MRMDCRGLRTAHLVARLPDRWTLSESGAQSLRLVFGVEVGAFRYLKQANRFDAHHRSRAGRCALLYECRALRICDRILPATRLLDCFGHVGRAAPSYMNVIGFGPCM